MVRILLLACVVACHKPPPPPPPTNTTPPAVEPDDPPEITACARYYAIEKQIDACTALTDEVRQDLQQRRTDMGAAISESGMDDSTPVDEEAMCEEESEYVLRVAGAPCKLQ
jgi:hypothetical protein